jgi:hypothetical protein
MIYTSPMPDPAPRAPSREGLREYLLVTAFLILAVGGAVLLFGDELRAALGLRSGVEQVHRP